MPLADKYVLIAAPHTSNWDFVVMMAAGLALGVWPHWVGKHTLFAPPFGWLARRLRGIPVDRRAAANMVEQLAAQFAARDRLVAYADGDARRLLNAYENLVEMATLAGLAEIDEAQLDRVGAFKYSPVEGAPANDVAPHVAPAPSN